MTMTEATTAAESDLANDAKASPATIPSEPDPIPDGRSLTRRGLVAGAAAGAAAWLGTALGRPARALAATGDPLILGAGNDTDESTFLHSTRVGGNGLKAFARSVGLWGVVVDGTDGGVGVIGTASNSVGRTYGVQGATDSSDGYGVWGQGGRVGVKGDGTTFGVEGSATAHLGAGVRGQGFGGNTYGVEGFGSATGGIGVHGKATAVGRSGVQGEATGQSAWAIEAVAHHPTGIGLYGRNSSAEGTGEGVVGENLGPNGTGVKGWASGVGVRGVALKPTGTGVRGEGGFVGVWGTTNHVSGVGVRGEGGSTGGNGVEGVSEAAGGAGVFGSNIGGGDGVLGTADQADAAAVHGANGVGIGVCGESHAGTAVKGEATGAGTAGSFEAPVGRALYANGPVQLDMASGIATIRAGSKFVEVGVGFDLTPSSKVLATLQSSPGAKTTLLLAQVEPAGDSIHIELTEKAIAQCTVAWLVLL
jgi:hypothetical protein